jgi:serine/threonine-protein kinase
MLALGAAVIAACAPAPTASPAPTSTTAPATNYSAGDAWKRAADDMDMLFVPAGSFVMGSDREMARYAKELCAAASGELAVAVCKMAAFVNEQPAHRVGLAAFWIDRTEVTNGQYQLCVQAGACEPPALNSSFSRPSYYGDPSFDDHPVVNVRWSDAAQYCSWAGARLPTEAEWEYAARGPASRIFPWGNAFEKSRLNYCDAGCALIEDSSYNDGYPDTAPVGSFPSGASWMGALDLAGNAREWVNDWLAGYPASDAENPHGPETGELKVPKGGSWYDTPDDVRSANRGGESLEYYRDNLGFRCARLSS